MTSTILERFCRDCAAITGFEAVPCLDGHVECHEVTCLACGAAVLLGVPVVMEPEPVRVASVA